MRNQQLEVKIKDGRLEVSIGVDLLCHAVSHGELGELPGFKITDNDSFAGEIARELQYEKENGETFLHQVFDAAATEAVENGADSCELN